MIKTVALGLAAFAALAATNPRQNAHAKVMIAHADKICGGETMGRFLCGGLTALASAGIEYDDRLMFSTARLGEVETIGILGQVVVLGQ